MFGLESCSAGVEQKAKVMNGMGHSQHSKRNEELDKHHFILENINNIRVEAK